MVSDERIYINTGKLRSETMQYNLKCISNLIKARDTIKEIKKLPENFLYKQKLEIMPTNIERIKECVETINKYINDKAREFDEVKRANASLADKIGLDMRPEYMKLDMKNSANQNTSPLNWAPSYQGGGIPNGQYSGYNSLTQALVNLADKIRNTGAEFFSKALTFGAITVDAYVTREGMTFNATENIDVKNLIKNNKELEDIDWDSIQGGCYDGQHFILQLRQAKTVNKGNEEEKEDNGAILLWINLETEKIEYSIDLGKEVGINEVGHGQGMTYDKENDFILCRNYVDINNLIRIDNKTKKIDHVGIPDKYRCFAYDEKTNQLIGFKQKGGTCTYMKYNEKKDAYEIDNNMIIKLKNTDFSSKKTNIQGMFQNNERIYLTNSNHDEIMKPENYRVWVYSKEGNKVEEHPIGNGFKDDLKEVESCLVDNDGNLWLIMPFEIVKVENYNVKNKN